MSLSRSAANLRQLRGSKPADASHTARTEGLGEEPTRASTVAGDRRYTASLGSLKSHSPPQPGPGRVAWADTADDSLPSVTRTKHRSSLQKTPMVWPPPDFPHSELPKLGTTQILAVRIDRSGAPLGAAKPSKSAEAVMSMSAAAAGTGKAKTRAVTLGGWRTGVTAVKHTSELLGTVPFHLSLCVSTVWL